MVVSNRNLLFQGSIFRCYVSFREGIGLSDDNMMKYHVKSSYCFISATWPDWYHHRRGIGRSQRPGQKEGGVGTSGGFSDQLVIDVIGDLFVGE